MSKILLLGAGFVTAPLVEYLHQKGHHLSIASQFIEEAETLIAGRENMTPFKVNVTDQDDIRQLIQPADIVLSFVPYQFHIAVAKVCIDEKTPMVTASYTHADMKALDEQAKEAGITILNEIGLDPGIDHMTAMQMIDEAHEKGQKVDAFVSWCGGIPAPDAADNPLGYKFSWSPMAVLTASSNDAKYLSKGGEETIKGENLLTSMRDVDISDELKLRGYANRDSMGYKQAYNIPEVQTLLRGTLRYKGFGQIIDAAKHIGLLSGESFSSQLSSWQELMQQLESTSSFDLSDKVKEAFNWLGCYSEEAISSDSPIKAFCELLTEKLKYEDGEQDMVVMQHRLVLVDSDGTRHFHQSTMVEKGDKNGFSAMAKTVGYPAAIAADMILSGKIDRKGVCIPVTRDIYEPILSELAELRIGMDDIVIQGVAEAEFLNNL
jgi:saccharopine dehydrogenase-like NADP-dependent oxidoreductase